MAQNNNFLLFRGRESSQLLQIDAGTSIEINGSSYTFEQAIDVPVIDGVNFSAVPTPTAQIGIGLVKNTDLKIRYVPTVAVDDFELGIFGIGVMHDIKQWIPAMKLVPIDLAGFIGTTKMSASIAIDDVDDAGFAISNGSAEMEVSATTVQVMISKKFTVFTPYASVGYNFTKSSINVNGEYTFKDQTGFSEDQTITNPIALEFKGGNSPRLTVGAQLKLLVLTIHADYTFQEYSQISAGIGISVR